MVLTTFLLGACMPGSEDATPLILTPGPTSTPLPTLTQSRTVPIMATSTQSSTFTPTVAVRPSATYGTLPWPENCEPEQVTQFVARFMDAFNRGDIDMLRGMLPDEDAATSWNILMATASAVPTAVVGVPVALRWFSMPHNDVAGDFPTSEDSLLASRPEEVLAFAAASHAAGIRLHLRSIMHARDWLPTTVTFGVEATLQMPGQPDAPWLGKAGIDCGYQRIFLWSMGPD